MNSLVADYSNSSDSVSESEPEPEAETETEASVPKLPRPDFEGRSAMSVFANPFAEAENAKKAILEKHVKMVPSANGAQTINGKKVCWNYRKGRCRFGHNCTFAHDSDLRVTDGAARPDRAEADVAPGRGPGAEEGDPVELGARSDGSDPKSSKRKRPGLGDGIVPGKKVMKFYKQRKSKPAK